MSSVVKIQFIFKVLDLNSNNNETFFIFLLQSDPNDGRFVIGRSDDGPLAVGPPTHFNP